MARRRCGRPFRGISRLPLVRPQGLARRRPAGRRRRLRLAGGPAPAAAARPHRRPAGPLQLRRLEPDRRGHLGRRLLERPDRAHRARRGARRRALGLRLLPPARPSLRRRLSRRLLLPQQRRHRRRGCGRRRAGRVAILDVDYHHGNGTQDIFYARGDVLFVSIHADPRTDYPFFWGHADETGEGEGEGATLNLPLPRGTGLRRLSAGARPALERGRGARRRPARLQLRRRHLCRRSHLPLPARDGRLCALGRRIAALGRPEPGRHGGRLCGRRARRQRRRIPLSHFGPKFGGRPILGALPRSGNRR